jgi:hypothetical protein
MGEEMAMDAVEAFYYLLVQSLERARPCDNNSSIYVFGPTNFVHLETEDWEVCPRLQFLQWDGHVGRAACNSPSVLDIFGSPFEWGPACGWQNLAVLAVATDVLSFNEMKAASTRVLVSHLSHWTKVSARVVWDSDLQILNAPRRIYQRYAHKRRRGRPGLDEPDVFVCTPDFVQETVDAPIPIAYREGDTCTDGVMMHDVGGHAEIMLLGPSDSPLPVRCNGEVWYRGVRIANVSSM